MNGPWDGLAVLVAAGALVASGTCLLVVRAPRPALPVLLDLLTAAGLLRLAGDPGYQRALTATAIVLLRHLIVLGLHGRGAAPDDRSTGGVAVRAGG